MESASKRIGSAGTSCPRVKPWVEKFPLSSFILISFLGRSQSHSFRKGAVVIAAGQTCNNIYLVSSGRVGRVGRLGGEHQAREVLIDEYGPGEMFAFEALIWSHSRFPAIAMEPSTIRSLPLEEFEHLLGQEPGLAMAIMRMLSARLARCHELSRQFAQSSLPQRIMAALQRLAADAGIEHRCGILIDRPIRHHELAKIVGASRSRVSLALGQLTREGQVSLEGGRMIIRAGQAAN